MVAAELDLGAGLAIDAGRAAEGRAGVAGGAALDAVAFPGLAPQQEDGDAREEAGEQAAQEPALLQVLGVPVDQARGAKRAAAACQISTVQCLPDLTNQFLTSNVFYCIKTSDLANFRIERIMHPVPTDSLNPADTVYAIFCMENRITVDID